ncbi:hypothetical protein D3C79_326890 [compost metagenome]
MIAIPHIPRRLGRDVQQAGVLLLTFHPVVAPAQRIGKVMGNVLVELFVLFFGHVSFAASPQRLRLVDFLPGDGTVFFILGFDLYRQRNVIGIFANHRAQTPAVEVFVFAFTQVQGNFAATIGLADICDGVITFTGRLPVHPLIFRSTCRAGTYSDFVRYDERRVEAHAELTDQLAVFRLVGADRLQEGLGTRLGNRPQVFDHFFAAHTDAVIGNRQGTLLFVERQTHAQLTITFIQFRLGKRAETQLVRRIGGVGDQLTQEDFFIGVQRMDHQMKQLFDFRLEPTGFLTFHTH